MPEKLEIDPRRKIWQLYRTLKKRLDWIPKEVVKLAPQYGAELLSDQKSVYYSLLNIKELPDYLVPSEVKCWDNLKAFLHFLTTSVQNKVPLNNSICVLSTEAVEKLKQKFLTNSKIDEDYYQIHYNNCFSLNYDGGKPFLYKGLYKRSHAEMGKLYYFVTQ